MTEDAFSAETGDASEMLALARAITRREAKEVNLQKQYTSPLTEQEPVEPETATAKLIKEAASMGRTVWLLRYVEKDDADVSTDDINDFFKTVFDRSLCEKLVEQINDEEALDLDAAGLHDLLLGYFSSTIETLNAGRFISGVNTMLEKIYRSAKQLSASRGLPTYQVYEDDALFEEAVRGAFSPEEYACLSLDMADDINEKTLSSMLQGIEEVSAKFLMEDEDDPEFLDEVLAEMPADNDPEIQKLIDIAVRRVQLGARLILLEQLKRFWGNDSLKLLSEKTKLRLAPKPQFREIELPGGRLLFVGGSDQTLEQTIRERAEVVKDYCAQKGWDPAALSVDQILEIRSLQEWQDAGE